MIASTSPFAATRSAATITASTSPAAIRPGAAASVITECLTPAWRSSHAAIRDPSNRGRVSATSAWTGRPAWWDARIVDRALPPSPPASAPVLPIVSTFSVSSRPAGSVVRACPTRAPSSAWASSRIDSASSVSALAIAGPSASSPSDSRSATCRSTARLSAADPGRVSRSALAAPRIVARRANGRDVVDFAATSASVTAATWAWTADPTSAPSLIALTRSTVARISRSTRMSGSRVWSIRRQTSPSQRNAAR